MRPTDVCHPFELRAPASRAFPASDRDFHRVDTPRSLRLRAVLPGDRTVHAARTALADPPSHNTDAVRVPVLASCVRPHGFRARAWAFSSHGARINRASDIPVATPRSLARARHLRACSPCAVLLGDHTKCASWENGQGCIPHRPVTAGASNNPGCLPSVGTLRRIRWPLQPRSRDRRVAFRPSRADRWMTLSRHPGSRPVRSRFCPVRPTSRRPFARCARRRFHPPTFAPR
jgi:hypothetical protein